MRNEGDSLVREFLRKWWVKVFLLVDVVLVIVVIAVAVVQANRNAVINFEVTPLDAEITLNGEGGYENGEYKVLPGEYTIRVTHDGMEPKELTVKVGANEYATVATFLKGEDGGFSYYELKENYGDYERLKEMASKGDNRTYDGDTSAEEFVAGIESGLAKMEQLPIVDVVDSRDGVGGRGFVVIDHDDEMDECTKTLCLLIRDSVNVGEDFAQKFARDNGYGDMFQIIYVGIDDEE